METGLKSGVIKPSFKRWDDLGKIWYTAAEMDNALGAYNEASKLSTDGKMISKGPISILIEKNGAKLNLL